ncbi:hypothetical protein [Acidocella sp.]|uniref:hypothetical protein n=1 Tax=Acidocella sp. TaxID=50710 RepID=UPI0026130B5B|nr:hypothetical protein [Acidocella sp.]
MISARVRSPYGAVLLLALVPLLFHAAIVTTSHIPVGLTAGGLCKISFVTVAALTHWGLYASLFTAFVLTLRPGHTPLVTAMASRELGADISAELAAYTRRVTIAWSLFFAGQLTTSVLLFCIAPLTTWSFFVNILDIPLVAAMFAAEYALRIRVLRNPPRHSLSAIFDLVSSCVKDRPAAPCPRAD